MVLNFCLVRLFLIGFTFALNNSNRKNMKANFLLTGMLALTVSANAQDVIVVVEEPAMMVEKYNRFSMNAEYGFNHVVNPLTPGYNVATLGFWHVGLGGRYMFNPKFGLRLQANYDEINSTDGSPYFRSDYFRGSLEGVINLGNVLGFGEFTRNFGLLFHAGAGYSMLDDVNTSFGPDHMMSVVGGLTPQWRIGDRWNIYADASIVSNANQDYTYDRASRYGTRGFSGNMYNYSVGLQYNFGQNERYADWVPGRDRYDDLKRRVDMLEQGMMDNDGDGVMNRVDEEPMTPYGNMVDTRGRTIVWYTVWEEMDSANDMTEGFTNFVNASDVRFETEKADVDPRYNKMLDNIAKMMNANPNQKLQLVGHADDRGEATFNKDLSERRANAVKDYLVGKGVSASRIMTSGVGETQPLSKEKTPEARADDRRVQFILK
jgi:OmpA-OmpF porin, OOP family